MTLYRKKYDQAFRRMSTQQFISEREFSLSESDIIKNGEFNHKTQLFLGCFPPALIGNMFKRYKVPEYFAAKGIPNISWHINMDDPYVHRFMLLSEKDGQRHKLVELVMQRKNLKLPFEKDHYVNMEFLHIEWLMMQNPYKAFRKDKPPLPGQNAPGLGIGMHMLHILINLAKRSNTHGIINSPNYLHTALFFSRAFHFIDPRVEAFILNVKSDLLPHYSYYTLSWADEYGALQHSRNHRSVSWRPATMIAPISHKAKSYFYSRNYRKAVRKYRKRTRLIVNMRRYKKKLKEHGKI
jgi:hypothetical protein